MRVVDYMEFVDNYNRLRNRAIEIAKKIAEYEGRYFNDNHVMEVSFHKLRVIVSVFSVSFGYQGSATIDHISFPSEYMFDSDWEKRYRKENPTPKTVLTDMKNKLLDLVT